MPVFGFNTGVKVGKTVFHVQTEDRGAGNPVLDTTIYLKGRVLAKRSTSYQEFLASPDFNQSELHAMLERQHKQFIEEIRAGKLAEIAQLEPPASRLPSSSTWWPCCSSCSTWKRSSSFPGLWSFGI